MNDKTRQKAEATLPRADLSGALKITEAAPREWLPDSLCWDCEKAVPEGLPSDCPWARNARIPKGAEVLRQRRNGLDAVIVIRCPLVQIKEGCDPEAIAKAIMGEGEAGELYRKMLTANEKAQKARAVNKILKPLGKRWCSKCNQIKPLSEFTTRKTGTRISYCRECATAVCKAKRERRKKNGKGSTKSKDVRKKGTS